MNLKFRRLSADEIDCRLKTVTEDGCLILLYKDARVDQNILDETVGCMNWQKSYSRDNANCTVSIWDYDKSQWISKEDTGTESQTEAEKGLASDSFKRACFNWGIGRELYTAPYIFINCQTEKDSTGKWKCRIRFKVTSIGYDEKGNINQLQISDSYGHPFWEMGKGSTESKKADKKSAEPKAEPQRTEPQKTEPQADANASKILVGKAHVSTIRAEARKKNLNEKIILQYYKLNTLEEMNMTQFTDCIEMLRKTKVQQK